MTFEEQVSHYAAVRRRLYGTPVRLTASPLPPPPAFVAPPPPPKPLSKFDVVLREVARLHYLDPDRILAPVRTRTLSYARWEVYWHLRALDWTLMQIGRRMRVDHTSVLHGLRRMQTRLTNNETQLVYTAELKDLYAACGKPLSS